MGAKNSPLNCTSRELEQEAIKRFRNLAFMPAEWGVRRKLNGRETILCLD